MKEEVRGCWRVGKFSLGPITFQPMYLHHIQYICCLSCNEDNLIFLLNMYFLTHYVTGYFIKIHKLGPIVIYYHVNTIGREYNWTRKDCPQMGTVGYKGL